MENEISDGASMFATIGHPHQLKTMTQKLSSSDSQLATLMNKHGARKFWAAVKAEGLEPQDIDRGHLKHEVKVSPLVPSASQPQIIEHRNKLWDGLRDQRLRQVETCLETMHDEQIRRYYKCKQGVQPVDPFKDLPPVDKLAGMDEFNEMQAAQHAKVKEEQRRKATALGLEFLLEKKMRDDADAKVAAFEKRIKDYKDKQKAEYKQRAIASQKKAEKRKADAAKAAQQRSAWEDETEAHLADRLAGAKGRREVTYSPEQIGIKLEANKQKRIAAFNMAVKQQNELLDNLENRRVACEVRLETRREEVEQHLAERRAQSQAKFQEKQVLIHAKTTEWVNEMLVNHDAYKEKCKTARTKYAASMKSQSKETLDTRHKAWLKVKGNKDKLKNTSNQANQDLMDRHSAADVRREELNALAIKNENDIHTFREIKHHSFGELVNRRNEENKKRIAAHDQHAVYTLAERLAKNKHQERSQFDLRKARQQIAKESLTFNDQAAEGFLKIQSEPDPAKVVARMNAMGFDMPKLPEKDDEGGEEEVAKGF